MEDVTEIGGAPFTPAVYRSRYTLICAGFIWLGTPPGCLNDVVEAFFKSDLRLYALPP